MTTLTMALAIAAATPAAAQMHDMGGMTMPNMAMPARPAPAKRARRTPASAKAARRKPSAIPTRAVDTPASTTAPSQAGATMPDMAMPAGTDPCPPEHAAMGHCTAAAMASDPVPRPVGTDQDAGDGRPPAPPVTLAAARFYDPAAMAMADRKMRNEHGGMPMRQVLFNLAEVQVRNGRDGYRWDGAAWFGGDIHRLVVKSEGDGAFGDRIERAEVQALYSRALDPYWNLQAGIRQDLEAGARRSYAALGIEGLAPYWFDVEGTMFLSDKGDVLARAEAWYDQRLTQRAILQPRVELNLAAQDMPGSRIGAGLSTAEAGLRLRYELKRELAPYVGVSWERRYGATARYARADGEDSGGLAFVAGLRVWF